MESFESYLNHIIHQQLTDLRVITLDEFLSNDFTLLQITNYLGNLFTLLIFELSCILSQLHKSSDIT